jgi:hypothetical protein
MDMQISVFDLDGTVVCSKHRYKSLVGGGIDLPYWIANNTAANCHKDSLLPTVRTMRKDYKAGCTVIVCTARVLSAWDYEFFMNNDIPYHVMLDRPAGCTINDADLKEMQLRLYAHSQNISWAKFCMTSMFFEDADIVLDRMAEIGMPTIDARDWNKQLSMTA